MEKSLISLIFRRNRWKRLLIMFLICLCIITTNNAWTEESTFDTALIIGQSYISSNGLPVMPSSVQDAQAMEQMLYSMDRNSCNITIRMDLTAEEIRKTVKETFEQAQEGSLCLLYYAGHGYASENPVERGALVGTDGEILPLGELCSILFETKKQAVVIMDSCYSGSILLQLAEMEKESKEELGIYALCAAGPYDQAESMTDNDNSYGSFTKCLVLGCDPELLPADRNDDKAISLSEAYYYIKNHVRDSTISPVIYPDHSDVVLWGRKQ